MNADSPLPLVPVPPALKLRRRLKGAALGLAIGAFLGALLCWMHVVPAYFQVRRDAPRLAAFNQQCAHPVIGNPATFDHAKAGQGACEAFPAVVKASSFPSPYERNQWRYSLSIGNKESPPQATGYFNGRSLRRLSRVWCFWHVEEAQLLGVKLLVLLGIALVFDVVADGLGVAVLSHRGDEVAVRPELAAP